MINEFIKSQIRFNIKKVIKASPEKSADQIYKEVYDTIRKEELFTEEEMVEVGQDIEMRLSLTNR